MKNRIIILLAILLSSCNQFEIATLITDKPEVKYYAELFNQEHDFIKIDVIYSNNPAEELKTKQKHADIIIADSFNNKRYLLEYRNLSKIVRFGKISGSKIYDSMLETGKYQGKNILLPLAFDFHTIVSKNGLLTDEMFVDYNTMVEKSENQIKYSRAGNILNMGFYYTLDPNTIFQVIAAKSVGFTEQNESEIEFNSANLNTAIKGLRIDYDLSDTKVSTFKNKYMYDTDLNLLQNDRVTMLSMPLSQYLTIEKSARDNLEFRYFHTDGKVVALDNILFVGIPKHSKNSSGAETVAKWFFKKESQEKMIKSANKEWLNTFGLAGKFSAVIESTEKIIPNQYNLNIPDSSLVMAPKQKPYLWEDTKKSILFPWLIKAIESEEEPNVGELKENLPKWIIQRSIN